MHTLQSERRLWHSWADFHVTGMGLSYVLMLTAFYVDNGKSLSLWRDLPHLAYWVVPGGWNTADHQRADQVASTVGGDGSMAASQTGTNDAAVSAQFSWEGVPDCSKVYLIVPVTRVRNGDRQKS